MEQRAHVLYIRHLIRKGHGYPFWHPEPDSSRPAAYTERGVHPGDVGILNDRGGFDHLFNVFRDADDPVNGGNVPPDFQPLRLNSGSPQITQACYNYNITSAHVNCTEVSAGISADVAGLARAEASFEFSTAEESAAILCLPHSATKHETLSRGVIKEYAIANGEAWYAYANGLQYLGRDAPNGSLYIVTGCDKTDSWGTAAVAKPSRTSHSVCLSFIAAGMAGGEARAAHTWSTNFSADTRVHPLPLIQYSYPVDRENQCIFARGFTISLRSGNLFKSDGKAVLRNISGSLKDEIPSFDNNRVPCPRLPGGTESSGRRSYFPWISHGTQPVMDNEDDLGSLNADQLSDTDLDCEISISEFPPRNSELMNPSAAMNLYLLEKDPSLEIVVTHDEEWMKIIQDYGDATDEILWGIIRGELDKRSLSPTVDFKSLTKVNAAAERDSDNQVMPIVSAGTLGTLSPLNRLRSLPYRPVPAATETFGNLRDIVPTTDNTHSESTPDISGSSYKQHASSTASSSAEISPQDLLGELPYYESVTKTDVEALERLKHSKIHLEQRFRPAIPYHALRFWAVLIGIDAYPSNPLQGCVSDALKMKRLLMENFKVPENRIQCLLGSTDFTPGSSIIPSRANIVNVLYGLIDNDQIQRGDNIIIYYAGHGSRYNYSLQWPPRSWPIEAMCPIDRDNMDPDNGCWIPDISDRELNAIFTQISCAKGHKITLFTDCCSVTGMNNSPSPQTRIRAMPPTSHSNADDMLHAAHTKLQHLPRYRSVSSPDWRANTDSQVIVAACQYWQTAMECSYKGDSIWGGEFTRSLIQALTSGGCNQGTTYRDLVNLLSRSPKQTPNVHGDRMEGPLWYLDPDAGL